MATSTYGTPYVEGSDLVSAYPTASSNLATRVDEVSYKRNGLNAQTGTTYTLVAGDAGKTITLSNASAVAVTLPQDSTADLPDGAVVNFYNLGAGTVTISQGTGATLNGGSITLAQYEVTSVIKLSANTYGRYDGAPAAGLNAATPTSIANSGGTATLADNTVTFTTVTTVSLNGCFTSSYTNYRIVINVSPSTTLDLGMRLRVGGTDASGSNYNVAIARVNFSGTQGFGGVTGTSWSQIGNLVSATGQNYIDMTIGRPFVADYTYMHAQSHGTVSAAAGMGLFHGRMDLSTAYDGFTLIPSTGTITGTVSVFGYRK